MRVAFFTSHLTKSLQWYWYCEALKNEGVFHLHVVVNQSKPLLVYELNEIGIPAFYFQHKGFLSHLKNLVKAIRLIRKYRIDIVHTSLPYGNLIGQLAGILGGVKARVTTCENASWAHDFNHRKQQLLDKFTFKTSKKVIAVADSAFEYLLEKWGISEHKLTTIYHGLKVEEYDSISSERIQGLRKQYNVGKENFVIGMIARLEFWKGHKYAIEAISQIKEEFPKIKLLIFGAGGAEKEKVEKQIEDLGLENCVKYMGFTDDPIAIFQLFDIHLHIPINKYVENCGINIIEGMISSRPQILTKSGYAFQSAVDHHNALVVNYQDAASVADAIRELINSEELRDKIAKNAFKDAIEQYSNEAKLKKHLALYEDLLRQ